MTVLARDDKETALTEARWARLVRDLGHLEAWTAKLDSGQDGSALLIARPLSVHIAFGKAHDHQLRLPALRRRPQLRPERLQDLLQALGREVERLGQPLDQLLARLPGTVHAVDRLEARAICISVM